MTQLPQGQAEQAGQAEQGTPSASLATPPDVATAVRLVAEIGVNHEGDADAARALVKQAIAAGVWAVKFQVYNAARFVSAADATRRDRSQTYALPPSLLAELTLLARQHGVVAFSSMLSDDVASLLATQAGVVKLASGDLTAQPLIALAFAGFGQVVMSTGGATLAEVDQAVAWARAAAYPARLADRLTLMHCVSGYPVPCEQANLRMITTLRTRYPTIPIGYSHHVIGTQALACAATLGATMLEFHFTLDKTRTAFRDHTLSLEPTDVEALRAQLALVRTLLGDGVKRIMAVEEAIRPVMRRSVMTTRAVPRGTPLRAADLTCGRPAGGVPPDALATLYGATTKVDLAQGALVTWDDVKSAR